MTSTAGGDARARASAGSGARRSSSRARQPHMNVFGGEDRFWLGPEGGQFSLYFKKGDPFDLAHWQVPEGFDWGAWDVASQSPTAVQFRKRLSLRNYAGTPFEIDVDRTVRLLDRRRDRDAPRDCTRRQRVRSVAFESSNTVTNAGSARMAAGVGAGVDRGFWGCSTRRRRPPSPSLRQGPEATLGPDRQRRLLRQGPGRSPGRQAAGDLLPRRWAVPQQDRPLAGPGAAGRRQLRRGRSRADARAVHAAGRRRPLRQLDVGDSAGSRTRATSSTATTTARRPRAQPPLGPFYELETSSPALSLAPGERYTHVHRTFHLAGPEADLDAVARATLKIPLAEIAGAFKSAPR